jgi:hypothetical protein
MNRGWKNKKLNLKATTANLKAMKFITHYKDYIAKFILQYAGKASQKKQTYNFDSCSYGCWYCIGLCY